jgi:hypothetical protein
VIEQEEPYESRGSRTVLWERRGETPLRDPTMHKIMRPTKLILIPFLMNLILNVQGQTMTFINGKDTIDVTDQYFCKDTNLLYFPTRLLFDTINVYRQEKDSLFYQKSKESALFVNTWFSKQLTGLGEPKLYKDYDFETYRFTWLRTFNNPISIRLEKRNNEYLLFVKRANGAGGYNPGQLAQNDTIRITESQWNDVMTKIYNINFWEIPTIEKSDMIVMDGAMWIFEARKKSKYTMVYRQSGKGPEIKDLCMMLLDLSGIKVKKKEIY